MGGVVNYQRTLFDAEHELFRESYRAFLERHVAPFHAQWEKDKIVDRGVWLEAGKQGFLGMAVPEEYGGGGNPDFRYNTIICEETVAGRYSGIGFGLHNDVVAPYLLTLIAGSPGEYAWGGVATTSFWIDPAEELIAIFMTQVIPSTAYPVRRELRTMVYAAITDAGA